jgi:hypothetical protein
MDQPTSPDHLQFRGLTGGKVYQKWENGARVERTERSKCERRELNPHPLRDRILSPARLPVPPRSRAAEYSGGTSGQCATGKFIRLRNATPRESFRNWPPLGARSSQQTAPGTELEWRWLGLRNGDLAPRTIPDRSLALHGFSGPIRFFNPRPHYSPVRFPLQRGNACLLAPCA